MLVNIYADPSKPGEDDLERVEVTNLGRKMWKYTISWKVCVYIIHLVN